MDVDGIVEIEEHSLTRDTLRMSARIPKIQITCYGIEIGRDPERPRIFVVVFHSSVHHFLKAKRDCIVNGALALSHDKPK